MRAAAIGLYASLLLCAGCTTATPQATAAATEVPSPQPTYASPVAGPSPSPSVDASPTPTATPLPSPIAVPDSPPPAGTAVPRQALPPAVVLPVGSLCAAPIQRYQDGNAGPLFCSSGAIVVAAWNYFGPADPHVLSAGRAPTLAAVESAICADVGITHATWPMELSGYQLAAAYYGWNLAFDFDQFQQHGTCP